MKSTKKMKSIKNWYMYVPEQSLHITPAGDVEKVIGIAHLRDSEIRELYRAQYSAPVEIVRSGALN